MRHCNSKDNRQFFRVLLRLCFVCVLGLFISTDTLAESVRTEKPLSDSASVQSSKTQKKEPFRFVALGNSITSHPVCDFWFYECGMAASKPSKDYVHQTVRKIKKEFGSKYSSYSFELVDSPLWELSKSYRKSLKKQLAPVLKKKVQLLVIQYGDNVRDTSFLEDALTDLIRYIQKKSAETKIVIIGNLELKSKVNKRTEAIKKKVAKACGAGYVDLRPIVSKKQYRLGFTKIRDPKGRWHQVYLESVALHPNDRGMEWIAAKIADVYSKGENPEAETGKAGGTDTGEKYAEGKSAAHSGPVKQGLINENGAWYFYRKGKLLKNKWKVIRKGKRQYHYYFGKDGKALCGSKKDAKLSVIGKYTYAFDSKAHMLTGVHLIKGKLFWFSPKGRYDKYITHRIRAKAKNYSKADEFTEILRKYGCRLIKKKFFGKGCIGNAEDGMYTFPHFRASVYKEDDGKVYVLELLQKAG